MDKISRARLIIDHVLGLDDRFSSLGPPRSATATSACRLISDDPRWEVRVSPNYHKASDGGLWDLFELFVYGQARMTAAFKGEEIELRFFVPGKWEPIFTLTETADTVPLLP